jgi:hypothetical protein
MRATSERVVGSERSSPAARSLWRSAHIWLLGALAVQYAVFQLLTGAQYWDGPRNLHWGLVVWETPRFLLDQPDPYNWVNGFVPDPPALAPAGMAGPQRGALHPWWGPLYLALFAAVWGLTGSYTLLQLVAPLAAGATVLLTYAFGARYLGRGAGMLAALLLALFPVFREHAVLSFVEPISALLLFGALWAFLARRTWLAAALGTLAMYGKVDLIFLYLGTAALTWLLSRGDPGRLPWRHTAVALGAPALFLLPWVALVYLAIGRPVTVGGGARLDIFLAVAPQMLDQLFTLARPLALGALALLIAPAGIALWRRAAGDRAVYRMLGVWLALGVLALLVYAALPGASNNPRVAIPALPALCLLAADGLCRLGRRARTYTAAALLALFVVVNGAGMLFQSLQARGAAAALPAWEALREAPRGVVLTELYWQAALFARQPVTWFEHDPAFERNIMHDAANFRRYLASAPIRYVVLPRDQDANARRLETPWARLYGALPLGRDLGWRPEPTASAEVRAYLEASFPRRAVGEYIIFFTGGGGDDRS